MTMKYNVKDFILIKKRDGTMPEKERRAIIMDVVKGHGYRVRVGVMKPMWITEDKIIRRV